MTPSDQIIRKIFQKKALTASGALLVALSLIWFLYSTIFTDSQTNIEINGLQTIPYEEIENPVRHYLKNNKSILNPEDIESMIALHPRVASVKVVPGIGKITINITEATSAYLVNNGSTISEVDLDDKTLQEEVWKKEQLTEDLPIFYLTPEKANEIKTLRSDIIRVWEKTRDSHSFIWHRVSEIVVKIRHGKPEITFYHAERNARIIFTGRFTFTSFRKLWAILYYLDSDITHERAVIKVYEDHATLMD